MIVLGIETSCDETSAAVVQSFKDDAGRHRNRVCSNVVYSQIARHKPYGGVVPEIASRAHVELLPKILEDALAQSGFVWSDLDAVAVTHGPGLASSLLIGLNAAKALAMRLDIPLIPVNHLKAHLFSAFLGEDAPTVEEVCPALALLVSGGHTCLVEMTDPHTFRLLGETLDDAAGEALDKGASLMDLGYPGGPIIEKTAKNRNAAFVSFPRGMKQRGGSPFQKNPMPQEYTFSFSGVKTALRYYLQQHPEVMTNGALPDVVASYQEAICDALADRTEQALKNESFTSLVCGGGVLRNGCLRGKLADLAAAYGIRLRIAEPAYCTDNAAMVAAFGATFDEAMLDPGAMGIDIDPNLPLTSSC
ncbi:MAG: tRNA (adenosine(37)-N6)-threonylcarbamoyltransferase complex transferase subunit TsaD [Spartobacteria bacterium]|nr:tRNA (adenosine(37)-N6)-threonylcarbamoyltransferase complex transferase subunit TsaD [Spartobacteria bacterium]